MLLQIFRYPFTTYTSNWITFILYHHFQYAFSIHSQRNNIAYEITNSNQSSFSNIRISLLVSNSVRVSEIFELCFRVQLNIKIIHSRNNLIQRDLSHVISHFKALEDHQTSEDFAVGFITAGVIPGCLFCWSLGGFLAWYCY